MGKRSSFARRPQDAYFTPYEAVAPLLPHLAPRTTFVEPCAGDGRLVRHLERHGHRCVGAFDIEPLHDSVEQADALTLVFDDLADEDVAITNPPWSRDVLHPLIDHWRRMMPTWLLFDADWMHTRQATPFLPFCHKIVSVGRVKWIEGSKMTGKDNAAWFLFRAEEARTQFFGR
jgi:hypothetical protein